MKFVISFLFTSFFTAGIAFATPTTVTAIVVNAGSPVITDSHGYDVGPYTLSLNGATYSALCVDVLDWSTLGQSYSAYTSQVGGNISNTYHSTDPTAYEEEAYLMSLITQPGADRVDIQDAAWAITDSGFKIDTAAQNYVNLAEKNYQSFNFSGYEIVSGTNPSNCNRPQEFIIDAQPASATPEPGTLMLLGFGLLLAGIVRKSTKRSVA